MNARWIFAAAVVSGVLWPATASSQSGNGIPDGSAIGGELAQLWVDDGSNTELTLVAFRLTNLRQRNVGFDLELAFAGGDGLTGFDLTLGAAHHFPLSRVGLLFSAGATAVAAGGGDAAGGAAGLQLGGTVLVPVSRGAGLRFEAAYRRYFTGGDGFNALVLGLGFTSLPR